MSQTKLTTQQVTARSGINSPVRAANASRSNVRMLAATYSGNESSLLNRVGSNIEELKLRGDRISSMLTSARN